MYIVDNLTPGLGILTLQLYPRGSATILNTGGDTADVDPTRAGYYEWTVSKTLVVGTIYDAIILHASGAKVGGGEVKARTGDTRIAITGNNSTEVALILEDTGTTLPAAIAGVTVELTPEDIQDIVDGVATGITGAGINVVIAASSVVLDNIDTLGNLTIHRGDTFSASLTNLGDMSAYSKVYFTVKRKYDDADEDAIIMMEATDGLTILNGVTLLGTGTASGCDLAVAAGTGGDVTIELSAEVTAELEANETWVYDIQMIETDGSVHTLGYGKVTVNKDVTQAIT